MSNQNGIMVNQSMIKDVRKYVNKQLCGLVLKAKYIDKTWPVNADESPEKKLGTYFEYILTGAVPRSGIIPEPKYTKTALKLHKRDPLRNRLTVAGMTKPYQLAHKNADRVKAYFKLMGVKILEVGVHFQVGCKHGTIDIIASYKGRRVVIDVKYSGLLHDKYNDMGWAFTDYQKKFHGTQALQYHLLTKLPFYFLVVSSTNEDDIGFFEIEFDEFSLEQHELEILDTKKKMEFYNDFGFNPVPDLVTCKKCPFSKNCEFAQRFPEPKRIVLSEAD